MSLARNRRAALTVSIFCRAQHKHTKELQKAHQRKHISFTRAAALTTTLVVLQKTIAASALQSAQLEHVPAS
eukprot:2409-Heterococcus_DN1.PRE.2